MSSVLLLSKRHRYDQASCTCCGRTSRRTVRLRVEMQSPSGQVPASRFIVMCAECLCEATRIACDGKKP